MNLEIERNEWGQTRKNSGEKSRIQENVFKERQGEILLKTTVTGNDKWREDIYFLFLKSFLKISITVDMHYYLVSGVHPVVRYYIT